MCGIFFTLGKARHDSPLELKDAIERRGPNGSCSVHRQVKSAPCPKSEGKDTFWELSFTCSVLSLRGEQVVEQPLVDEQSGSLLCWNGEIWRFAGKQVDENDTTFLFSKLVDLISSPQIPSDNTTSSHREAIIDVLSQIEGPFSFVLYDATEECVYYGRDFLGRRSLLMKALKYGVVLSSVAYTRNEHWVEVESNSIHVLDLKAPPASPVENGVGITETDLPAPKSYPWSSYGRGLSKINADFEIGLKQSINVDSPIIEQLHRRLDRSIRHRALSICGLNVPLGSHSGVAILFSGGIDCTVLARLCHDAVPPGLEIDLLNVAFENPRKVRASRERGGDSNADVYSLCPDRQTGLSSYAELSAVCPGRNWNFVKIDVPFQDTEVERERVLKLMYPHSTEMDYSISLALYFASRGIGSPDSIPASYSAAKVLFSGLGADELFGGYGRHAVAFSARGYSGLVEELDLDIRRIAHRNLGRDDRVISDSGKEVRYPYLDEELVNWVLETPVQQKCDFGREDGAEVHGTVALEPAKHMLRLLAWKLGIRKAAAEKKRAIQFGALTAKMVSGRSKGTELIEGRLS